MNITHASSPIYIDGVEYELSPITLEDLEYLDTWIKSRALEAGRMSLPRDMSAEDERRAMLPIAEAANKLSLFGSGGISQILDPLGISRFLMRLLRKRHPDVTPQRCFDWMIRQDVRDEITPKLVGMFTRMMKPRREVENETDSRPQILKRNSSGKKRKRRSSENSSPEASLPSQSD